MTFNDTTTNQGIVQETDFLLGWNRANLTLNRTNYPLDDIVRNSNDALNAVIDIILTCDNVWQWDDSNNTDLPIGTTDIAADQADYSYEVDFLTIESMQIKDANGYWHDLKAVDKNNGEIKEILTGLSQQTGFPEYYDKFGDTLVLYPTPDFTRTESLRAVFQRTPNYFESGDTVKQPGFAKHLHKYIPLYNAFQYAMVNNLPKKNDLFQMLEKMAMSIKKFYGRRDRDTKQIIRQKLTRNFI